MLRKLTFFLLFCSLSATADVGGRLASPNGGLEAQFGLDDQGAPWFQLLADDVPLIRPSPLGISLHNTAFVDGLEVEAVSDSEAVTDRYRLWTGKRSPVEYHANRRTITLRNPDGHAVTINFQLSNDGLAYRYEFPGTSEDVRVVTAEHGGVHFFHGTRAWLQPLSLIHI